MSTDRPPRSSNPAAFNRSLKDRIRNETTPRGRSTEQLRHEFFLQRFLARVFSAPGERWLLKGGASLLVRRPDARYSQDIDLLHTSAAVADALSELVAITETGSDLDPFRYVFDTPRLMSGGVSGASVKVKVYLGAVQLADFPIDLSTELVPVGEIDYQLPRPVVEMDELAPMPKFALYPLPQQVSDKVWRNVRTVRRSATALHALPRPRRPRTDRDHLDPRRRSHLHCPAPRIHAAHADTSYRPRCACTILDCRLRQNRQNRIRPSRTRTHHRRRTAHRRSMPRPTARPAPPHRRMGPDRIELVNVLVVIEAWLSRQPAGVGL
ncbi:hypothetical protein ABH922_005778 [Rhodococcus sp. 27YEA15]|uniref:nucleotidyl transferase AbiEii/AbiGii toxin family protein n=1 Tax=Rhodococcus sp. 27YEA15 TaxID=3156259 RepID=UPI003C7EA143